MSHPSLKPQASTGETCFRESSDSCGCVTSGRCIWSSAGNQKKPRVTIHARLSAVVSTTGSTDCGSIGVDDTDGCSSGCPNGRFHRSNESRHPSRDDFAAGSKVDWSDGHDGRPSHCCDDSGGCGGCYQRSQQTMWRMPTQERVQASLIETFFLLRVCGVLSRLVIGHRDHRPHPSQRYRSRRWLTKSWILRSFTAADLLRK